MNKLLSLQKGKDIVPRHSVISEFKRNVPKMQAKNILLGYNLKYLGKPYIARYLPIQYAKIIFGSPFPLSPNISKYINVGAITKKKARIIINHLN
jgi:hypothetical protein